MSCLLVPPILFCKDLPQETQGFHVIVFPKLLLENCHLIIHFEDSAFKVP